MGDLSGVFVDPELSAAGLAVDSSAGFTALPFDVGGLYTGIHTDDIVSGWAGVEPWPGTGLAPPTPFPVITNLGTPVAAGLGEADAIGRLSVPTGWTAAAPEVRPMAMALPAASAAAAEIAATSAAGGAGSVFSQMALAGMAGSAVGGGAGAGGTRARPGERVGAPARKPAEPAQPTQPEATEPQRTAGGPITGIAAELRELASLRDSGILTEEEFVEQKRRLLPH